MTRSGRMLALSLAGIACAASASLAQETSPAKNATNDASLADYFSHVFWTPTAPQVDPQIKERLSGGQQSGLPAGFDLLQVHGRLQQRDAAADALQIQQQVGQQENWLNRFQWVTVNGAQGNDLGAELTQADFSLRQALNLPDDRGLVVSNLVADGPASKVGLQANDILLSLAEVPLDRPEDLEKALKAGVDGKSDDGKTDGPKAEAKPARTLTLKLVRKGKPLQLKVQPRVRVTLDAVNEDRPDYFIGTPSIPVDETLRSHLDLPAGTGLVINGDVEPETPAAKAGIKKGDILLSFDGQPVPSIEALRAKIQETGEKKVTVELLRAGKKTEVAITPARRPKPAPADFQTAAQAAVRYRVLAGNQYVQDLPQVGRLFSNEVGQPREVTTIGTAPLGAQVELSRKIDELTAQVQALTKSVEELRRQASDKGGK